jgi:glucose/arabinose dehydrogenase
LEDRHLLSVLTRGFVQVTVAQGLKEPTSFAVAPNHRIFVAEKPGVVQVIQNGRLLAKPVLKVPR